MRIVSTSRLPIAMPGLEVCDGLPADLSEVVGLICLLRDRIDAAVLARAPKLKVVANCAVGVDNVDLAAARERGVVVANTPDVLTEATAEFALTLALAAARRLGEGERLVRSGRWTGWALDQLLGVSLGAGQTCGVIGMGRIGQAMARRCAALGMRVVFAGRRDIVGWERVTLDRLFAEADLVTLHCPLVPETRGVVNARTLGAMNESAVLVNTARGGCVDDDALIAALHAGRIFGAGLDVYAGEPAIDGRYHDCPRVVLAPHIGSATTEVRTAMAQLCVDAVTDVLAGRMPRNVVG